MKISQAKVNIPQIKGLPKLNVNMKKPAASPKTGSPAHMSAGPVFPMNSPKPVKPLPKPAPLAAPPLKDDYSNLKEAAAIIQRIRLSAQQELEQVRKMRADAVKYQQETATRARSDAHQLILHTRLETQREIEELIRQASEEIQKVLADIRVIRITAQEELATQRKFTDAAKLSSMSLSIKDIAVGTERKKKKQLVASKA